MHINTISFSVSHLPLTRKFDLAIHECVSDPGMDRSRVLVIGDSLRTDVRAADAAGLASAIVPTGVLRDEIRRRHDYEFAGSALQALSMNHRTRPGKRKPFEYSRNPSWLRQMFKDPSFSKGSPSPTFFLPGFRWED